MLRFAGETLFAATRSELRRLWSETSYRMQALRDDPDCARQAFETACNAADPGLNVHLTFDPAETEGEKSPPAPLLQRGETHSAGGMSARPRMAILREQGVNGQIEICLLYTSRCV